ncbi:SDR family oxidoreductase [Nocardioides guangzhouensis]|uniref:SDR family oxidoreductase n=1 Tax=Nocardioides guangzhouensis TaxID=2497878 RepID=A0A4V1XYK2_9ACTN|nr:mycofactocin-coupled SDR family oxidoreductase [Nocardioides guangzhouensis]RYP83539.1 SDR family oxidoreductase [Nocardioides guangzhouensis]
MDRPVALVTGAARGIGAATVRRLRTEGYAVCALDVATGGDHGLPGVGYDLASRAELDGQSADDVLTVVADVRDPAALEEAADRTVAAYGRLDVAVAAAAVVVGGQPLWKTPAAHLETLWAVDVLGVQHLAAATVPRMLAGRDPSRGRFVAVASAAGSRGLFHLAAYSAAKHAVVGLVRGLAADLVGTGVTATAVSPGATDTAMLAATADLYGVTPADLAGSQLLREPLDPDEVAAVVAFCCSPEGRALNGSVVAADGGFAG